jgi:hypothetical protein
MKKHALRLLWLGRAALALLLSVSAFALGEFAHDGGQSLRRGLAAMPSLIPAAIAQPAADTPRDTSRRSSG